VNYNTLRLVNVLTIKGQ